MSAINKVGVVVAIGVAISVAYYFLNKSKPKIAEAQLAKLETDTVTAVEETLARVPTIEKQLLIDKCAGLGRTEYEICTGVRPAGTRPISNATTSITPTKPTTVQAVAGGTRGASSTPIRTQTVGGGRRNS